MAEWSTVQHYNLGKYEVIDVLEDWFTTNPLHGQVVSIEIIIESCGTTWRLSIGEDCAKLQANDAEAAKREAVALFRAKLQAALKELEGL